MIIAYYFLSSFIVSLIIAFYFFGNDAAKEFFSTEKDYDNILYYENWNKELRKSDYGVNNKFKD